MQGELREICIITSNMSYKNSIIRRAPFDKLYNLLINDLSNSDRYLDYISISTSRHLNPIQLKICKVS